MSEPEELLRLEIPAQPVFVGLARTVAGTVATTVGGIGDERVEDLRLAVSEACTNAVEAHLAGHLDHRVVLSCLMGADHFEVRVDDRAAGFDPGAVPTRLPVDTAGHLRVERGWGLQLIRALVDEVSFVRIDGGTSIRLAMRRAPAEPLT